MARTKYSEQFCGYCNKTTRMEMVGEMQGAQQKVWYRCIRCHHMSLIDIKAQLSNQQFGKLDAGSATPYTPQLSFQVGEAIFHSEWNDVGKVVSKIKTSDGSQAIIVAFEKQGQRTLIENVKPEMTSIMENTN
jgi:hypothetical protein